MKRNRAQPTRPVRVVPKYTAPRFTRIMKLRDHLERILRDSLLISDSFCIIDVRNLSDDVLNSFLLRPVQPITKVRPRIEKESFLYLLEFFRAAILRIAPLGVRSERSER